MSSRRLNDNVATWVSLLSVPLQRIRPHFWTFSGCFVATLIFYIYVHVVAADGPSWREVPSFVMSDTTRAAAFWLFASPIAVEGVVMVFAAMFRQKVRDEGKVEGREEAHDAWRKWNQRRQAADATGEPFNEPPPDPRNGSEVPPSNG